MQLLQRHFDNLRRALYERREAVDLDRVAVERTLLLTAAVAAGLTVLVFLSGGYHAGFAALNALGRPLPEPWLQALTYGGDGLFLPLLLLLAARRYPRLIWLAILALLISNVSLHLLKMLFDSARPAAVLVHETFRAVGPMYRHTSFPSGHASSAFVMAGVCVCLARRHWQRTALLLLATLIGWSRVAVGVHWPVDVLAGAAIGMFSVWLAIRVVERWHLGMRPYGFLVLLLILCAAAVFALFSTPDYPYVQLPVRVFALLSLAMAAYDFIYLPLRERHPLPPFEPFEKSGG